MDYNPDNRFTMLAAALVVGGTLFTATQVHAANVIIAPSSSVVTIGDTFTVDVLYNGEGTLLGSFDFDLTYDANVLSFTNYTFGNGLGIVPNEAEGWDNIASGVISLHEFSYLTDLSFQSGTFILATLTFEGLYMGEAEFTLDNYLFGDEFGAAIQPAVNQAPVPVPSAGLLMFTALIGLVSLRRGRAY